MDEGGYEDVRRRTCSNRRSSKVEKMVMVADCGGEILPITNWGVLLWSDCFAGDILKLNEGSTDSEGGVDVELRLIRWLLDVIAEGL